MTRANLTHPARPRRAGLRNGFSLTEVLLAIFILGFGILGIAAIFPAGIFQQRQSVDDLLGPVVANNAMAILRMKVRNEDFGGFDQYGLNNPEYMAYGVPLITGDWPWIRPGVYLQDHDEVPLNYPDNPNQEGYYGRINVRGAIDIFSHVCTLQEGGFPNIPNVANVTEFPNGRPFGAITDTEAFGIPFRRTLTRAIILQTERYYPSAYRTPELFGDDFPWSAIEYAERPQYVWDCLFRRINGQVYVAIFVYRVREPGGEVPHHTVIEQGIGINDRPPLPRFVDNVEVIQANPLRFRVPQNQIGRFEGSNPGWVLDEAGNVHRVLVFDPVQRIIETTRPVPDPPVSTRLWFIPREFTFTTQQGNPIDVILQTVHVSVRPL